MDSIGAVPGRSCGSCGLCCKLLGIEALGKESGRWCDHFAKGKGCTIHGQHPTECRTFLCLWRLGSDLDKRWKPNKANFLLYYVEGARRLVVEVDPAHPVAWRQRPFHRTFREWSARGMRSGMQVLAKVDRRLFAITPNADIDLGDVEEGDVIDIGEETTAAGKSYYARRIPAADVTPEVVASLQTGR